MADMELFKSRINHIGFNMNEMLGLIADETVLFADVVNLALSSQQPYARYSAWIVTHYTEKDASLIEPYCDKAVDVLHFTTHDGQLREILRWFSRIDYRGEKEGELVDFCFSVMANNSKPIAVRIHAMAILERVIDREPDLAREFVLILEEIFPYLSVGGKNRAAKMLKKYNDIYKKTI